MAKCNHITENITLSDINQPFAVWRFLKIVIDWTSDWIERENFELKQICSQVMLKINVKIRINNIMIKNDTRDSQIKLIVILKWKELRQGKEKVTAWDFVIFGILSSWMWQNYRIILIFL